VHLKRNMNYYSFRNNKLLIKMPNGFKNVCNTSRFSVKSILIVLKQFLQKIKYFNKLIVLQTFSKHHITPLF
jgi:hypothetical protein